MKNLPCKTFVHDETGKKFNIGKNGVDSMVQRMEKYVKDNNLMYAVFRPSNGAHLKGGESFICSACNAVFIYDNEMLEENFITIIIMHGLTHVMKGTPCRVTPMLD